MPHKRFEELQAWGYTWDEHIGTKSHRRQDGGPDDKHPPEVIGVKVGDECITHAVCLWWGELRQQK